MEQVSVEEARKHLGELVMPGQPPLTITKNGIPVSTLVPYPAPSGADAWKALRDGE